MNSFIFDVDGTLLDSEPIFYDSLNYALELHSIHPQVSLHGLFGLTVKETLAKLNIPTNSTVGAIWEKRFDALSEKAPFYAGIEDTFARLSAQKAHIILVTSRNHATVDPIWKKSALSAYIEFCVAAEDTTKHKPHPEPLLLAISALNLDPKSTIYIGDTVHDYAAAQKAGISFAAAGWNEKASSLPGIQLTSPADLLDLM